MPASCLAVTSFATEHGSSRCLSGSLGKEHATEADSDSSDSQRRSLCSVEMSKVDEAWLSDVSNLTEVSWQAGLISLAKNIL